MKIDSGQAAMVGLLIFNGVMAMVQAYSEQWDHATFTMTTVIVNVA